MMDLKKFFKLLLLFLPLSFNFNCDNNTLSDMIQVVSDTAPPSSPVCDGSNGNLYIQPVIVRSAITLQAVACGNTSSLASAINSATYTITSPPPAVYQMGGATQLTGSSSLDLFGAVTTFAGKSGSSNGIATVAGFVFSYGITTDGTNLHVADTSNHNIRRIE